MSPVNILWLRRDLRLHDHASLNRLLHVHGRIQPVFIFDRDILAQFPDPQDRRLSFIADALRLLHVELLRRSGGLLVVEGSARMLVPRLAEVLGSIAVAASEDYEPAAIARDNAVAKALGGKELLLSKDQFILSPSEVMREGKPYKVFTPYAKRWREIPSPGKEIRYASDDQGRYADFTAVRAHCLRAGIQALECMQPERMLEAIGYHYRKDDLWRTEGGRPRLEAFIKKHSKTYKDKRDFPALDATSRLSPYLRFGLLSVRECYQEALPILGADKWIEELIWREFYAMILYHFPESADKEWNPAYRDIPWSYDKEKIQAWEQGRTGFPLIDAAMRQLLREGWMHNRARMIVASFLTKDLHIDWRVGEKHFARYLMDYELASNVGGWQWAASTGTDAQPYFRVFNPILQSRKFDPDGDYIRRYVPELAHLDADDIHMPPPLLRPGTYPAPMVDHDTARKHAVAMFRKGECSV